MTSTRRHAARLRRAVVAATAVAAGAIGSRAFAQSCAMCAASFAPDDPIQRAFSWSILFLMAAPYTIVAVVGGWLFFTYRRAAGQRRAAVLDLTRARRPAPVGAPGGNPS